MAQHKAPTAVSVAPIQEKEGFGLWLSQHWIHGAVIAVAIAAGLIIRDRMQQKEIAAKDGSWEKLNGRLDRDQSTGMFRGEPSALSALAVELKDTVAGPSARLAEVESRFRSGDYAGALGAIDALEREHPTHHYVTGTFVIGGETVTLTQSLRKQVQAREAFDKTHPGLFANPEPAADAPKVRLVTDKGAIVVALYVGRAPKHCENFLKLCREGYYNSTKFHRVIEGFMIQGGDPNSKEGDPATWGLGGPGYKIDAEPSDDLFHFAGMLAMAKTGGDTQSSGSQFYITADAAHQLDGQYTVFGKVLEGMDVVKSINAAPNQQGTDRPATPVVLTATEVLP